MLQPVPIQIIPGVKEKATANRNSHYEKVAETEDAKKHLTMLPDHLIWQYLLDLLQLLQAKGIMFDIPWSKRFSARNGNHHDGMWLDGYTIEALKCGATNHLPMS